MLSQNMYTLILLLSIWDPKQTHLNQLINLLRITRKLHAGTVYQGWSLTLQEIGPTRPSLPIPGQWWSIVHIHLAFYFCRLCLSFKIHKSFIHYNYEQNV